MSDSFILTAASAIWSYPAAIPSVLIVDDNSDAADMLQPGLEMLGHVFATHDGATALSIVAEVAPDLALLDIGLPGMDGYELARRIRGALGDRAPVLIAIKLLGGVTARKLPAHGSLAD
jgi:CheY-like chemotaxis protein